MKKQHLICEWENHSHLFFSATWDQVNLVSIVTSLGMESFSEIAFVIQTFLPGIKIGYITQSKSVTFSFHSFKLISEWL